jgi:hypothetical protein
LSNIDVYNFTLLELFGCEVMDIVRVAAVRSVLALDDHQELGKERQPHLGSRPRIAVVCIFDQRTAGLWRNCAQPAWETAINMIVFQGVDAVAHRWMGPRLALENLNTCTIFLLCLHCLGACRHVNLCDAILLHRDRHYNSVFLEDTHPPILLPDLSSKIPPLPARRLKGAFD